MKRFGKIIILFGILIFALPQLSMAEEGARKEKDKVFTLEDIEVTAPKSEEDMVVTPSGTEINIEEYETPGITQNVTDILKDLAIIDVRATDLVPEEDTINMRGFSGDRFVTALDGLTIQKTGGRKGSHIVDYALLPVWDIEKVEILPGPHSALYPSKSIGGVINIISKTPVKYDTLKPDFSLGTSYKSYNTQNHNVNMRGGAGPFVYGLGFQKYHTDGYVRRDDADIDTISGKFAFLLPSHGYISLNASYSDADRKTPVVNDPNRSDYDDDYPKVLSALFEPWQEPTWDKEARSFRLKYQQPSSAGLWNVGAYYSKENRDRSYYDYIDKNDTSQGTYRASSFTEWVSFGSKIQDEITFSDNHVSTIGLDISQQYDGAKDDTDKRIDSRAGFFQHQWTIRPRLNVKAGLRYEAVKIWVSNRYITTEGEWIERDWSQFVPKSFLTYELDDLSPALRDTSLSLGLSKIWHPPTNHGAYNPQGRPTGAYLDPEHGFAYDFIVTRRLWQDVKLKMDYAFYEIKDYMIHNRDYAKYTPSKNNPVEPGKEYSDYMINLEKVQRHGVEVELGGNLLANLSFYISYAYQEFKNKGSEPAGTTGLDDLAKHRLNAGLSYDLFRDTLLMLDYKFQDEQVSHVSEEIAEDEYVFYDVSLPSYQVFDFAVKQKLFKDWHSIREASLKFYVNNLFDEEYQDVSGYPMTGRTCGAALSCSF